MKKATAIGLPEIMALSVQQPAASDIAAGAKTIEYRTWQTRYRGPLLIVASKSPRVKGLPSGQAVCVVDLVACERGEDGVYEWQLQDVQPVEPFDVKGRLGLYKVTVSASLLSHKTSALGTSHMSNKVFTFGYQGHKPEDLLRECQRLGAVVCDIRFRPVSRNPVWNQSRLKQMFGERYMHIGALGNRNYKGGPIDIADMEAGLNIVLEHLQRRPVVLMCVCRDFEHCHRRLVAEKFGAYDICVESLVVPTAESRQNTQQILMDFV
jgi:hypothetical protein